MHLNTLQQVAGRDVKVYAVYSELERDGYVLPNMRRDGQPNGYATTEYLRLGAAHTATLAKEESLVGALNGVQITTKLVEAMDELHKHSSKYDDLFGSWRREACLAHLKQVIEVWETAVAKQRKGPDALLQPNPWAPQGIGVESKRYLSRVISVFTGTGSKHGTPRDPSDCVAEKCAAMLEDIEFGAHVELIKGPPKQEERIMEKARGSSHGDRLRFDAIHDYGRISLIVDTVSMVPRVVQRLLHAELAAFEGIRVKNRLDPDKGAADSGGYRDCQILVREPRGGWIVEIQVIPRDMYALKVSCGHRGYKKYRFVLEACKRARFKFKTATHAIIAAAHISKGARKNTVHPV